MHPFLVIALVFVAVLVFILLTALAATAILTAIGINQAARERKAEITQLLSSLPCTDCGQCGNDSCQAFAEQLLDETSNERKCGYITQSQQNAIDMLLEQHRQEAERRKSITAQDNRAIRKSRAKFGFGKTGGQNDV